MKAPFVIGRLLFGGFFLNSGIEHLRHRHAMEPYVESKGLPAPELMVTLSAVPLLAGGASLVLGIKPKLGALAILGFLGAASPMMHDFWNSEDPQERARSRSDFMTNMALAGAALSLMSIEQKGEKRREGTLKRTPAPQVGASSLIETVRQISREIAV